MNKESEQHIIEQVQTAIQEKGYPFELARINKQTAGCQNDDEDFVFHMVFKCGDIELQIACVEKKRVDKTTAALLGAKKNDGNKNVIITPYVSSEMGDRLKDYDIEFMDTCGNLYLNRPPLYVFVKGNKRDEKQKPVPVIRAFKSGGLKVLFTLLSIRGSEEKTFRELAALSGVSIGTVDWVMKDLVKLGYLIHTGVNGRTLIKKKELIDRWVTAYPEQLKTKLNRSLYQADDSRWWKDVELEKGQAFWSGEVAVAKLTDYLIPQFVTLYIKQPVTRLVVENKLRNDRNGPIEIFDAFWNFDQDNPAGPFVPPILIYADLMSTGDSRNIETAKMIYDEYIAELV